MPYLQASKMDNKKLLYFAAAFILLQFPLTLYSLPFGGFSEGFHSFRANFAESKFNPKNWELPSLSSASSSFQNRLSGLKSSKLFSPSTWENPFASQSTRNARNLNDLNNLRDLKEIDASLRGNTDHLKQEGVFRRQRRVGPNAQTVSELPDALKDDPIALAQIYKRKYNSIVTPLSDAQVARLGDGTDKEAVKAFVRDLPSHQKQAVRMAVDMGGAVSARSDSNKMEDISIARMLSNGLLRKDYKDQQVAKNHATVLENSLKLLIQDAKPPVLPAFSFEKDHQPSSSQ